LKVTFVGELNVDRLAKALIELVDNMSETDWEKLEERADKKAKIDNRTRKAILT
jgi:hypothetical protein